MSKGNEDKLVHILGILAENKADDAFAIVLEGFIQRWGPLSEETGAKVRELLKTLSVDGRRRPNSSPG